MLTPYFMKVASSLINIHSIWLHKQYHTNCICKPNCKPRHANYRTHYKYKLYTLRAGALNRQLARRSGNHSRHRTTDGTCCAHGR